MMIVISGVVPRLLILLKIIAIPAVISFQPRPISSCSKTEYSFSLVTSPYPLTEKAIGSDNDPTILLREKIGSFPTRGYVTQPTPIDYLPRLTKYCDGPELYVKRDDLLPLAGGGSKTRKLDFLIQEAIDNGADTIVTCGAVQSNHCRLTASAAAREGIDCYLILEERIPGSYDPDAGGNNYIFALLGAKQIPAPLDGVDPVRDKLLAKLKSEGKSPYFIPGGGSNQLGALGYIKAALEIVDQSRVLTEAHGSEVEPSSLFWDAIVVCSGSGGTHTGILTGLRAAGITTPVHGVSVRFKAERQVERIRGLCEACIKEYFDEFQIFEEGLRTEDIVIHDEHIGGGYSIPTIEMAEAIQAFARMESIVLDPVYTGKTASALFSIARCGVYNKQQRVLFIHTGGAPSLYHYQTLPDSI